MNAEQELKELYGYLEELDNLEKKIDSMKAEIRMYKADAKEIKQKIADLKEGKGNGKMKSKSVFIVTYREQGTEFHDHCTMYHDKKTAQETVNNLKKDAYVGSLPWRVEEIMVIYGIKEKGE